MTPPPSVRRLLSLGALLGLAAGAAAVAAAQSTPPARPLPSDFKNWQTVPVAEGIYAFIAPDGVTPIVSGNSTVIIGDSGVVVVDAGQFPSVARAQIAAIRKLTPKPVRWVVNTHWHPDHWLGNGEYAAAFPGVSFIATRTTREMALTKALPFITPAYAQSALDMVTKMLADPKHPDGSPWTQGEMQYYSIALPQFQEYLPELKSVKPVAPNVLFTDSLTLVLGAREVRVMFLGRANTGGDAVVYVPDAKVLMTGDLVVHPYPYAIGSYIGEWIETMKRLEAIDAAVIVPGHGAVERDKSYLMMVSRLLESLQSQVSAAQKAGLTLEETRKKVDFSAMRTEFCGTDTWCTFGFDGVFVRPGVGRAYREAKEGPLKDED
ncbi:MAG TPA: MBL fold metallo-hydrolase [Dongiaceae bacterium]|nr:MBL fold metallo-hydrolase [Dongiaceae bacterium]